MTTDPVDNFNPDMDVDEPLTPFDARDHSGRRAMVLLAAAFGFLLILALVVFRVYQPGVRDRSEPPKILADNTPFKVKPDNPGGLQMPDQDKTVYDVMDGQAPDDTVTTMPEPEKPIQLPKTVTIDVQSPDPVVADTPPVQVPTSTQVQTPPKTTPETPPEISAQAKPRAPDMPAPPPTSTGGYVVQVASVRSRDDADAIWTSLKSKFSTVMSSSAYPDVKRADLGDKGIYYRLRVAGMANKDEASRLCARFKAGDQACFVTKR